MAKPRVSINAEGLIMCILKKDRSSFVQECVNEAFADHDLYKRVMKRVRGGLTAEDFLPPGYIIVEAATLQQAELKPPKTAPQEPAEAAPAKAAPAAKPASDKPVSEQKPVAQPAAGAEGGVRVVVPAPVDGKPIVLVTHPFGEEEEA
jgi:nucleoid-associated protein YgaU